MPASSLLARAAAATVAALALGAAPAAGQFSDPLPLGPFKEGVMEPAAASAPGGAAAVAWLDYRARTLELQARASGGAFSQAAVLTTSPSGFDLLRAVYDPDGQPVVTFRDYAQDAGLSALIGGSVAQIPGAVADGPTGSILRAGGDLGGALAFFGSTDSKRAFVSLRPRGGAFGEPVAVSPSSRLPKVLALDVSSSGEAAVVWNEKQADGTHRLFAKLRPPGGAFPDGDGLPLSEPGVEATSPALAYLPDGTLVLAWVQGGRVLVSDRFGPPVEVGEGASPQLSVGPDGTAALAYRAAGQRTFVAVRPPGAARFGDPALAVEGGGAQDVYATELGIAADGSVVLAYEERTDTDVHVVATVRRPGESFGPGLRLDSTGFGSSPAVAGDLVGWVEGRVNAEGRRTDTRIAVATLVPRPAPDGPGTPAIDRTAPTVRFKALGRRGRRLRLRLTSDEAANFEVKPARLLAVRGRLVAGRPKIVTVRGVRRGRLRLRVRVADAAGNVRTLRRTVRVR